MTLMILRRKGLGLGSAKGMKAYSEGRIDYVRNDKQRQANWDGVTGIIRWGCTSSIDYGLIANRGVTIINTSEAIHRVNHKSSFAKVFGDAGLGPECFLDFDSWWNSEGLEEDRKYILRPGKHAQGRNLHVLTIGEGAASTAEELFLRYQGDAYTRPFVDKVAEYRVYVMCGKVFTVAKKTPANPSAVAWNVAQGGRFDVVSWGDWPLAACEVAVKAFHLSGLHFSGVDVMVDADGKAYVIELNSAPSLPALSDGSVSYRQKVMAKAFMYHEDIGWDNLPIGSFRSYRECIHPSCLSEE